MEEVGGFTTAHTLSDQDIVTALARIHTTETSLAASRLALLAEAERRGLAHKLGHSSIKRWYSNAVRIPEGNAAHQIALGYWLGAHPSVAEALSDVAGAVGGCCCRRSHSEHQTMASTLA
ncbi:hypothetical protein [Rhodococcus sp. I2R]|uniref:hypothetical protein n=1 Tax=Rhodococcus sp. I2R TaxID=2855445 RepID=UPI001E616641|nr:hypothetical protein [Rhodococcus sp. I2R]MCC8928760.1 hypothetical protein [Rhodococcus sp. I2R]